MEGGVFVILGYKKAIQFAVLKITTD